MHCWNCMDNGKYLAKCHLPTMGTTDASLPKESQKQPWPLIPSLPPQVILERTALLMRARLTSSRFSAAGGSRHEVTHLLHESHSSLLGTWWRTRWRRQTSTAVDLQYSISDHTSHMELRGALTSASHALRYECVCRSGTRLMSTSCASTLWT